jgi:hypothetical protein
MRPCGVGQGSRQMAIMRDEILEQAGVVARLAADP